MPQSTVDPATLRPLSIHADQIHGHERLIACTPHFPTLYGQYRITARRLTDPALIAKSSMAVEIQPQVLMKRETHWKDDAFYNDLASHLVCDWLPELLSFLFVGDPITAGKELAAARDDWKTLSITRAKEEFRRRQHLRIFGALQPGDLALMNGALMLGGKGPFWVWECIPAKRDNSAIRNLLFQTHSFYGTRQESWFSYDPKAPIYATKLGPKSLARLPQGTLSTHQKLALLGAQAAIDAARAPRA